MMRVVAELMILANAAVGRRIAAAFPRAALLRRHPPPRREAFAEVEALCQALGSPLDLDSGPAALAASLAAAAAAAPPAVGSLIKGLATRAMSEAHYFCTGGWVGGCMGGWVDEWVGECVGGCMEPLAGAGISRHRSISAWLLCSDIPAAACPPPCARVQATRRGGWRARGGATLDWPCPSTPTSPPPSGGR